MRNFIFKEMNKLNTIRRFAMVRWFNHIAQIRRNIREVTDIYFGRYGNAKYDGI